MKTIHGVQVPTTLAEWADPAHTALIVVDMQNEIWSPKGGYSRNTDSEPTEAAPVIREIQRLLEAARRSGTLVVYAEYVHRNRLGANLMDGPNYAMHRDSDWVSCVREGTWGAQTIDELTPQEGEFVFTKSRGSSFKSTNMDDVLRTRGIRTLILTGCATGGCVMSTHIGALSHGYYPLLVTDAISPAGQESWSEWMQSMGPSCTAQQLTDCWQETGRDSAAETSKV
jgi:nicotinamidase-related amidase